EAPSSSSFPGTPWVSMTSRLVLANCLVLDGLRRSGMFSCPDALHTLLEAPSSLMLGSAVNLLSGVSCVRAGSLLSRTYSDPSRLGILYCGARPMGSANDSGSVGYA